MAGPESQAGVTDRAATIGLLSRAETTRDHIKQVSDRKWKSHSAPASREETSREAGAE